MATLTIKNLPDEIYAALSAVAKRNRRSINGEAIVQLEQGLKRSELDATALLAQIRRDRNKLAAKGVHLTDKLLAEGKRHRV
ncbi:MAG: Arc family DNA-binding protein [Acidobacteria bacterium ACB1]|nr:hypothetical protein [Pyrinomonadaceae bacterium]MCE7961348.1 Arc family DNA-binding protein [Acidobacteria bacterium ACB1]RIJ91658.1 MAG: hypothetical protein DCC44_09040 [Acidobacteriota bacterium]